MSNKRKIRQRRSRQLVKLFDGPVTFDAVPGADRNGPSEWIDGKPVCDATEPLTIDLSDMLFERTKGGWRMVTDHPSIASLTIGAEHAKQLRMQAEPEGFDCSLETIGMDSDGHRLLVSTITDEFVASLTEELASRGDDDGAWWQLLCGPGGWVAPGNMDPFRVLRVVTPEGRLLHDYEHDKSYQMDGTGESA